MRECISNQTKTPARTEVTAVWSSCVWVGREAAALCKKWVSVLRHYLTAGFARIFKTSYWIFCPCPACHLCRKVKQLEKKRKEN